MKTQRTWTPLPNLLMVEPWDEEGQTPSGLWLDHVWEDVAGHAFGRVLQKAETGDTAQQRDLLKEISVGDLILFTRSAYTKSQTDDGEVVLFVNVEDVISILLMDEDEKKRYGCASRVD